MDILLNNPQLAKIFGLLGNIVSFLVFLSPLPTFYAIFKKKSSGGYQSIPYVVTLCSSMLFLYYGLLKSAFLIISINSIGCVIEVAYLIFYLIYAPPKEKKITVRLILLLNVGAMGLVIFITNCLIKGPSRLTVVGWTCVTYNIVTFAAPLSIVKQVIKTKSVEFMPFSLSCSLTLCATTWFFYGLFVEDFFIATPNVAGFVFGVAQMILYCRYMNNKGNINETMITKQHDQEGQCKGVSLSFDVDSKDIINQPDNMKEMKVIVDHQKPTESNKINA